MRNSAIASILLVLSGLAYAGGGRPGPAVPVGADEIMPEGSGSPAGGYTRLSIGATGMAAAGSRLVALQNNDGGWDWPLDDGNPGNASPLNTIGPIGTGLAKAYRATGDASMLTALGKVSTFLLAKTNNFSPSDGYLAAELDSVLGVTTHVAHLNANFYGPLAAGTYDRNGAGTLYTTAAYVNHIRTSRASQGIANLAAWDVAMGLVAAKACGAAVTDWVAGTKAEIDELDGDAYYDVVGLAGAIYGLKVVNEEFDPTAGEHAAASSLSDLADILVSYQITASGGFTWNSNYVIANDGNETIQETAYAIMALNAMQGYRSQINAAVNYMLSVQLVSTGGWENYVGSTSGENNEITAEGTWGVYLANNVLSLDPTPASIYVKPTGETCVVDLNVANLLQPVTGLQAMLNFSSTYFKAGTGEVNVAPGGGSWDQLIWNTWTTGGDLDVAVGVKLELSGGTQADATTAIITLTPAGPEGITRMVFRPDAAPDPGLTQSTYLSDASSNPVWPAKVDSIDVYIDGTAPVLTIPDDYAVAEATQTITASAADALSGMDTFTMNGNPFTGSETVVLVPGANTFVFVATDKAGNSATDTLTVTYNQPAPTIDIYHAIAPNVYAGGSSHNAWLANEIVGARDETSPVGSGYAKYEDFGSAAQDYAAAMVTSFQSWMGLITTDTEWGSRTTYVYRLDNGVQGNPGAAKLNLDNIDVTWKWNLVGADNSPADDYTYDFSYAWNAPPRSTLTFAAGTQRLKGYNWDGSAWVEVTSGREADLIIYNNGEGYEPEPAPGGGAKPATQATLNELYKQLTGALASTGSPRQTVSDSNYIVAYSGHASVGDAASADVGFTYDSADTTDPVITITAPADGAKVNVASQAITGTVTDNETLASGVREVKITLNSVEVYSNTTQDNVSFSQAVTLAEGSNTITVNAEDFAGNTESKTITVILDTSAPTISIDSAVQGGNELLISLGSTINAVQGDVTITVSAADTGLSGLVTPPVVKVTDSASVETTLTASGSGPWTYTYTVGSSTANGVATISATVSDGAGNSSSDTDTFNINKNQITGQVELEGFVGASRVVTFVATGGTTKTWTPTLSFTSGVASYTLTDVPAGTTGLSAKTAWSLRNKLAVTLVDGQATADFTGAEKLLAGDINGTNSINVLDYSILKTNWLSTTSPVADINGSGAVNVDDYNLMKGNWFKVGDPQ